MVVRIKADEVERSRFELKSSYILSLSDVRSDCLSVCVLKIKEILMFLVITMTRRVLLPGASLRRNLRENQADKRENLRQNFCRKTHQGVELHNK